MVGGVAALVVMATAWATLRVCPGPAAIKACVNISCGPAQICYRVRPTLRVRLILAEESCQHSFVVIQKRLRNGVMLGLGVFDL